MSGYVYFLKNPSTGLTKIGYSIQPHVRKAALEIEHGNLEVVAIAKTDEPYALEQQLHALADSTRVEGEWFRLENVNKFRNLLADKLVDWSEAVRVAPMPTCEKIGMPDEVKNGIRAKLGYLNKSQAELARELGIHPTNFSRIMTGKNIGTVKQWLKILDALDLELIVRAKQ